MFFPIQVKTFWFKKIIYCVVWCQIFERQLQGAQSDCAQFKLPEQLRDIVDFIHSTMRLGLSKWYCYVICLVGCKFHDNMSF
jgi:hypothetical protein